MKQSEVKFQYYIDSSINLDEILDTIMNEINPEKGKVIYFSLEKDDLIEKEIPTKEIKKQILKIYTEHNEITIDFDNVEINIGEDEMNIASNINLDLDEFDAEEKII